MGNMEPHILFVGLTSMKISRDTPQKLKVQLSCDLGIPSLVQSLVQFRKEKTNQHGSINARQTRHRNTIKII
jgi:hypothetical protein